MPVNTQWFVLFRSTGIISVGRTAINGILKILAVAEGVDESDELSYDLISDFNTRYGRLPAVNDGIGLTAQLILPSFPVSNLSKKCFLVNSNT